MRLQTPNSSDASYASSDFDCCPSLRWRFLLTSIMVHTVLSRVSPGLRCAGERPGEVRTSASTTELAAEISKLSALNVRTGFESLPLCQIRPQLWQRGSDSSSQLCGIGESPAGMVATGLGPTPARRAENPASSTSETRCSSSTPEGSRQSLHARFAVLSRASPRGADRQGARVGPRSCRVPRPIECDKTGCTVDSFRLYTFARVPSPASS